MVAVALRLAAAREAFDQGGAQAVGRDFDLREQEAFALAQSQRGLGGVMNPSHIYGQDSKTPAEVNKKEHGSDCESAQDPENMRTNVGFQKVMRNRWRGRSCPKSFQPECRTDPAGN